MIPILFEEKETDFNTNGIGRLSDLISCSVTEERNGIYELKMVYPTSGRYFDKIKNSCIIYAKASELAEEQPFRIYNISKPLNKKVTIKAEHISYQLNHIPVEPFSASNPSSALLGLKNNAVTECPYTFWTDIESTTTFKTEKPLALRKILGGSEGSIIDTYGGEFEFDNYVVKLHSARGSDKGVTIRYGKNLTDINQEESIENTITGIYPYWYKDEELVTLTEKIVMSSTSENYPFKRVKVLDMTYDFETKPTEDELRTAANSYVIRNNIGVPKVSIKLSFEQLWQTEEYKNKALIEKVGLCDYVKVIFEELKVEAKAKVTKTEYDVILERYNSIELGETKSNLSTTITEQKKQLDKKPNRSILEDSIKRATELISGNSGGYVVTRIAEDGKPYEILIMDTEDINTAQKVWRWNLSGLGYSSNGVNGPYRTAITVDGEIVADFITAGSFNGNILEANTVSAEALSVEYKNSVIEYSDAGDEKTMKEMETELKVLSDSITMKISEMERKSNEYEFIYSDEEPTLDNYPANTWYEKIYPDEELYPDDELTWIFSDEEYKNHLGTVVYDEAAGKAYKFTITAGGEWYFKELNDTEINAVMNRFASLDITIDGITQEVSSTKETLTSDYYTKTEADSKITQTATSIKQEVSASYTTKDETTELSAELELKVNLEDLISEINASADVISLSSNRLIVNSSYFKITSDGKMESSRGSIAGWDIDSSALSTSVSTTEGTFKTLIQKATSGSTWIFSCQQVESDATYGNFIVTAFGDIYQRAGQTFTNKFAIKGNSIDASTGYTGGYISVDGAGIIGGNLTVHGTKNRAVETKNHGTKLLNAYEMTTPMFGDIGIGKLDDNGECIIYLDEEFTEVIEEFVEYIVFLQSYSQYNVYVEKRERNNFVVKGEPGKSFAWEVKARQLGYGNYRMESPETNDFDQAYISDKTESENTYDIDDLVEEDYSNIFNTDEDDMYMYAFEIEN